MATTQPTSKVSAQLTSLLGDGTLQVGPVTLSFTPEKTNRIVIGFLTADDNGLWLSDVCAQAELSLLKISAPSPADFDLPALDQLLRALGGHPICKDAQTISMTGKGAAGTAAVKATAAFHSPILVAFDPLMGQDAPSRKILLGAAKNCRAAYLFYDPFHHAFAQERKAFSGQNIHWLKCFGLIDDTLNRLWRMKLIPAMLPAALLDELNPAFFYKQTRKRKDYRFYRTGMETALLARGKTHLHKQFRAAFRARLEAQDPTLQLAKLKTYADEGRPKNPDAWALAGHDGQTNAGQDWPSVAGNVWMLEVGTNALRYLSDRWHGVTMGFEERAGVTLAQTPSLALGMVSFGHGAQVERPLTRAFQWHVVSSNLDGKAPATCPAAEATLHCEHLHSVHAGLPTIMAFSHPAPGITASEAMSGASPYKALLDDVRQGYAALEGWNKAMFVDRVRLALLSGSPQTTKAVATEHYAIVAQNLRDDLMNVTQQDSSPAFVVIQSAGSRSSGASEVILAEGQFDLDNLSLPAIVPSPAYPWPLMKGTPATLSADASMLLDELSMLAVAEYHQGRRWYCPILRSASATGRIITAEFSTMSGLVLEDGPHGFQVLGADPAINITRAEVIADDKIALHLDADLPEAKVSLAYAWGHHATNEASENTANHGTLRDQWTQISNTLPSQTLRRFALAGRVAIKT